MLTFHKNSACICLRVMLMSVLPLKIRDDKYFFTKTDFLNFNGGKFIASYPLHFCFSTFAFPSLLLFHVIIQLFNEILPIQFDLRRNYETLF